MPPQTKETFLRIDVTQAALPFNSPVYEKNETQDQMVDDESQQTTSNNDQAMPSTSFADNSNMRVTTRARYTYELDRFQKNAMLIFDDKWYPDTAFETHDLDEAFKKFGFEVEKYNGLNSDQIIDVCNRFFQRDFTDCGAVAIALSAKIDRKRAALFPDTVLNESLIISNFTENLPATLKGKPIIYITETDFNTNRQEQQMYYPEILNFQVPVPYMSYTLPMLHCQSTIRPLELFSHFLNEDGDKKSLLEIMNSTVSEIINISPFYRTTSIRISSTLSKELILVKS